MPQGSVYIKAVGSPPQLRLERKDGVPDDCWLRIRAELRGESEMTGTIKTPAERLFTNRAAFRAILEEYQVRLRVDERTSRLLHRRRQEGKELKNILDDGVSDETKLGSRLSDTRFTRELFQFQKRDLGRLLALSHGANFSVPGAGKTCVTYALYELERAQDRVDQMIVVAPLSAFDSWEREAKDSLDPSPEVERYNKEVSASTEVLLTGYQRLWANYGAIAEWASEGKTHIILDEAHRMKAGRKGEWGSTCLNLAYAGERRDILTGTPAPNSPEDMVSELDFLWPTHGPRLIPDDVKTSRPPPDAGARIAGQIGPLFVRTRKSELGLPEPEFHVKTVGPDSLQESIYDALRNRYAGKFHLTQKSRVDLAQMGEVVMYLLEAATNPSLLVAGSNEDDPETFRHPPLQPQEGSDLYRLLEEYSEYETPAKFQELAAILEEDRKRGEKTLVWSNFVNNIRALERLFSDYNPALLYGDIPTDPEASRSRNSELERFRNDDDCRVLLANPSAASEGMSLHKTCHHAVYLERTFNAGQYLQSLNRIHRLGLPENTTTRITLLQTENTIDEVVHRRVSEKAERLGEMLEDPDIVDMELPSPEDFGLPLKEEKDVEALFAHLHGSS